MRAVVFHERGGVEKLRPERVPTPDIGPRDVLVRVKACGVNRLDLQVRSGPFPENLPLPHISGSEVAGEIAEIGEQVSNFSVGQAVVVAPWLHCGRCEYCLAGEETMCEQSDILGLRSNGGYAEYVPVPARNLVPLPAHVSYDDGAAVTLSTLTAWHMLVTRARLKAGETVLILAAGSGIGSAAIQIAKVCGARVITTAGSHEKLLKARELGADEVVNYCKTDFQQEVMKLTNHRGVDVVLEHVGATTWEKSVDSLVRNGRLVTCGATTGSKGVVDIEVLFVKQLTLIGSRGGTRSELAKVLQLVSYGQITPVIHQCYPLEAAAEAQRVMEARRHFGKLILNP